jgi:hypothetical protein
MAGREQNVLEDSVPVELEAAAGCAYAVDARAPQAPIPAASLAQPLDMHEELTHRRVVAVEY